MAAELLVAQKLTPGDADITKALQLLNAANQRISGLWASLNFIGPVSGCLLQRAAVHRNLAERMDHFAMT